MTTQPVPRALMEKIVDEVFDGSVEDTAPIDQIYAVIERERAALAAAPRADTAEVSAEEAREHRP